MVPPAHPEVRRHQVVVVGGGFGGLPACRFLGRVPVDVHLIDRRNHHLFQPLLYQVATGVLPPGAIAPPLRHVLRHDKNVTVDLAEVTGFDLDRKLVFATRPLGQEIEVSYDSLIVATGVTQSYFGHDEFAPHAPGMKTIDDALELRRRILGAFEMAESAPDDDDRRDWLTTVVVGAGPTGVELAGQIRELATRAMKREFRAFDPASMRVVLIDTAKEPLATFGDDLSQKAAGELEKLGVELRMGARVTGIDERGVDLALDGSANGSTQTDRIPTRTVVWAAGVQASPLAKALAEASGAETDRAGRIELGPDLTLPGHPEVFVVGDMATTEAHLPGVAEVAMQGSLHAANTIRRRLVGELAPTEAHPFRYRDLGSVATIGRFQAVFSWRRVRLSGFSAWLVWLLVHLTFLNGFASRIAATLQWARSMIGRARAERVFTLERKSYERVIGL
jgi:NADH dehydrogenase